MSCRQLDWELLKELECPVCLEYMSSPIKMCENGHNICGSCKERLLNCPTCRGTFLNVRNVALEKLAATAIYPCKNCEAGCEETFTLDDRNKHLSVCVYQSRKCPFACSWTGILSDIPVHIRTVHESGIAEAPEHFNVKLLDLLRGRIYYQLVLVMGEFFCLIWSTVDEDIDFIIMHIGVKENSEAFKFGIKIGNSEEYLTATRECHSYLGVDLPGWSFMNYVTINYDNILEFVSESGCLSCEIEIGRQKLDGFVLEELQEYLPVVSVVGFDAD
jgi:hypothetical protein